jgi:glucokinase
MQFKLYDPKSLHLAGLWLVGDVGGTNCNLGLATVVPTESGAHVTVIAEAIEESHAIDSFADTLETALEGLNRNLGSFVLKGACISGAGPIQNNVCQMTNQAWVIDGNELEAKLGLKVHVINDFTAVCFGLPLLDHSNSQEVLRLHRTDGKVAEPQQGLKSAIGAGTGLGVGFIVPEEGRWRAFPSEGGHMDFADFDAETREFKDYVYQTIDIVPEYEMFISGNGIKNMFYFYTESGRLDKHDPAAQEIFALPDIQKPVKISQLAKTHPVLKKLMQTFVRLYARFAASVASLLLPVGGLYLAGGIAAKNQEFFLEDQLFMRTFEQHCNPNIYKTLAQIPVFITLDYGISLKGAAYAGHCLEASS